MSWTDAHLLRWQFPLDCSTCLPCLWVILPPLLIITAACGIEAGGDLQVALLQNAMLIAGIVHLYRSLRSDRSVASFLSLWEQVQASSAYVRALPESWEMRIVAYGSIMAACFIGGLFETVLGSFLKPLRKFFPSVATGTVVLSIGLSLIGVGNQLFRWRRLRKRITVLLKTFS